MMSEQAPTNSEKKLTTVHSRFQACCEDGCGSISFHQKKVDAISACASHGCKHTLVYDLMGRHWNKYVWRSVCRSSDHLSKIEAVDRNVYACQNLPEPIEVDDKGGTQ